MIHMVISIKEKSRFIPPMNGKEFSADNLNKKAQASIPQ